MAELRTALDAQGYGPAQTLLQSGNVVLRAENAAEHVADVIESLIGSRPICAERTHAELRAILDGCPFPDAAVDRPNHLICVIFPGFADLVNLSRFSSAWNGPERLAAFERELIIDYAGSIADSKLARSSEFGRFTARGTARNWNTLNSVAALMEKSAS